MFSYIWKNSKKYNSKDFNLSIDSDKTEIKKVLPIIWREHCIECSMPLCYQSCSLYEKRKDDRCLRLEYGIIPYKFNNCVGANIHFKKWAKLEAIFSNSHSVTSINSVNILNIILTRFAILINALSIFIGNYRLNQIYERLHELSILFFQKFSLKKDDFNNFYMEVYNNENKSIQMNFEIFQNNYTTSRTVIDLKPGWNIVNYPIIGLNKNSKKNKFLIWLNNSNTVNLIFKHLEFTQNEILEKISKPAKKVKCVAWDLDNTLWDGVIGDDGDKVIVNNKAIELIRKFDDRGILNTIVSKNTYEIAWSKIEKLGIDDYFLYPAINWGRKSHSLEKIANELNINIDTFAVIDDSAFERKEIKSKFPQVRVFDPVDIDNIPNFDEFNVEISNESKLRRKKYQDESKRKIIRDSYGNDYSVFLKSCEINIKVKNIFDKKNKLRCLELIQRSNQYNLSTNRYTNDEFDVLIDNKEYLKYSIEVSDKFGDYGIVGFVSIQVNNQNFKIKDFVLSCRVAQKMIEETFIIWLAKSIGYKAELEIKGYKTKRNSPLIKTIKDIGLNIIEDSATTITFKNKASDTVFQRKPFINIELLNDKNE